MSVENNLTLNTISDICNHLGSLVEKSYTKHSRAALILRDTGEILITKSGIRILTATCCHHPIAKLIQHAVNAHYEQFGDGTKTFILLVKEIMSSVRDKSKGICETTSRIELTHEFLSLIHDIPCIFTRVRENVCNEQMVMVSSREGLDTFVKKITMSFFITKFNKIIAKELSLLICKFISGITTDIIHLEAVLNCIITKFPVISSRFKGPLSESCTVEGIIFSKKLLPTQVFDDSNVNFVVYTDISDRSSFTLHMDNSNSVVDFIHLQSELYDLCVRSLKDRNITFVFMSSLATAEFKSSCYKNNVHLIDNIEDDEVDFLLQCCSILPLPFGEWAIDEPYIGCAEFIKTVSLNNCSYLSISVLPHLPHIAKYHHLSICAPTESLSKECYLECQNALKTIKYCFTIDTIVCSERGICFCYDIHKVHDSQAIEKENSSIEINFNKTTSYAALPYVVWEMHFLKLLSYHRSDVASSILASALFRIIKRKCDYAMSLIDCRHFPVGIKPHTFSQTTELFFEAITPKEFLILNVLSLVVQLLKVNGIVNVKSKR